MSCSPVHLPALTRGGPPPSLPWSRHRRRVKQSPTVDGRALLVATASGGAPASSSAIRQRDRAIVDRDTLAAEKDAIAAQLRRTTTERDRAVAECERAVGEATAERDRTVAEATIYRDRAMAQREALAAEKDAITAQLRELTATVATLTTQRAAMAGAGRRADRRPPATAPLQVTLLMALAAHTQSWAVSQARLSTAYVANKDLLRTFAAYEVECLLGSGCNGMVVKARCTVESVALALRGSAVTGGSVEVAIKVCFNFGMYATALENSFAAEFKVLQTLEPHPNVVTLLETMVEAPPAAVLELLPEETAELVMSENLVTGVRSPRDTVVVVLEYHPESLLDFLRVRRGLGAGGRISICLQIVEAVLHLHRHRVLHFDLKLDNFVVAPSADGNDLHHRVVLVDFGCAERVAGPPESPMVLEFTARKLYGGNPGHLSPEVHEARFTSNRSGSAEVEVGMQSAFAVGLLIWEVCVGDEPYRGNPMSHQDTTGDGRIRLPDLSPAPLVDSLKRLGARDGMELEMVCGMVHGLCQGDVGARWTLEHAKETLVAAFGQGWP